MYYDWLYTYLPAASKQVIKEAIRNKGLVPSLDSRYNLWLQRENNWNQVCNAGMVFGALAIYEDDPAFSRSILERALKTIGTSMAEYAPDGTYPEGYGYWAYGTTFNVLLIDALKKIFGTDFGMSRFPGFLSSASYFEHMTGPGGKPFNYADCVERSGLSPAMFWFASHTADASLLWVEKNHLINSDPRSFGKERVLPAMLLWYAQSNHKKIEPPKNTSWFGKGSNPVALMRTSWTDPNAIYVGVKGGSPALNHAHMDAGSFVLDAQGVRWAMDFGMQDYESLESKGIILWGKTQDAERWTVFRYTNKVHNTLTVNGQLQQVDGSAEIIQFSSAPNFQHAVVDLSAIYKGDLSTAKRGLAILNKKYVVVRDEFETPGRTTNLRWTLLTPATVSIQDSTTVLLSQQGKTLQLKVQASHPITMKTWPTESPNSYDAPNPGTSLVGFEMSVPANTTADITVYLIPSTRKTKKPKAVRPLSKWK